MGKKCTALLLTTMLISLLTLPALAVPENDYPALETVTIGGTDPATDAETGEDILVDYVQNYESSIDVEYSGPLDPLTGQPLKIDFADANSPLVSLKEGVFAYDKALCCYVNFVGSQSFQSNVPNGAIISEGRQSVSITIPSGLSAALYQNGTELPDADLQNIMDAGSYILEVSASNGSESVSFSFRILGKLTNSLAEFSLPAGFTFDSVMLEKDILTTDYNNYTQLMEDGSYDISWSCPEINQRFTTSFIRDTEAPTLELPEVTDGQAHSAVTLTDLEDDAYVVLENKKTGESKTIRSASDTIDEAGSYLLTVYDQAGNFTSYDFVIHVYLNLSAVAAIALTLAGVLALWLYSRYIYKHPRVG